MFYALVPHTNAHAIRCRPTPKDDERFRNGSVHEFHIVWKRWDTSDVEKIKNVYEQNFDKKRIVMLDKEMRTQRINLNSKYRSLTIVINILILCSVTMYSETKNKFRICFTLGNVISNLLQG